MMQLSIDLSGAVKKLEKSSKWLTFYELMSEIFDDITIFVIRVFFFNFVS